MLMDLNRLIDDFVQKKVDFDVVRKQIFPVASFFAVSLVLSNKAYIYLSVSYIQVSLSLMLMALVAALSADMNAALLI
jgi:hypothetical protein